MFENVRRLKGLLLAVLMFVAADGRAAQQTAKVEVTGVGLTFDQAEQDAYTRAIERAVGVLVDSETLVKNDEIIRDKVLTWSRGCVEKFEVVRRWKEEGLQYIQARAWVALTKLVENLGNSGVAVKPLSGRDLRLELLHEIKADQNAAEIFARDMAGFRLDKLLAVELLGEPEVVARNELSVRMRIAVRVSPNLANWQRLLGRLASLLEKVAYAQIPCTIQSRPRGSRPSDEYYWTGATPSWQELKSRLVGSDSQGSAGRGAGRGGGPRAFPPRGGRIVDRQPSGRFGQGKRPAAPGTVVAVFYKASRSGTETSWKMYRVPASLADVLDEAMRRQYRLKYAVLDGQGNSIRATSQDMLLGGGKGQGRSRIEYLTQGNIIPLTGGGGSVRGYWVAPFSTGRGHYVLAREFEKEIDVDLDKLGKVVEYAAFLEEVEDGGRAGRAGRDP